MPKISKDEKVFALGNTVLVEMIEEKQTTDSGLAIPTQSNERETCAMGRVINTGFRRIETKDRDNNLLEEILPREFELLATFNLQKGDIVLLKKFDYVKVSSENSSDLRIYDAKSVLGKVIKNNE